MRILMTADTVGGVWTYAMDLCRALANSDIEIVLATMGASVNETQRLQCDACRNVHLEESRYKLEWMPEPWQDVRDAGRWLLALRDRYRPDLVHLNNYCHGALDWGVPSVMVAHSCVLSWWAAVKCEPIDGSWTRYRQEVFAGLAAASVVIAPTASLLGEMRRLYGPFCHDRVIHNGRDASLYRREAKLPYVLSAGRLWDEAKNVRLLEDASHRIAWPVHLAGDSEHPTGTGRMRSTLRLLGKLTPGALAEAYSRAGIYAAPALYEPFGLAVLEAALSGCALVLADIPSFRELWGDAAVYADPHDPLAFAEQINVIADDEQLRMNLSERAYHRAMRYSVRRMAAGYLEVYSDVAGRPAPLARRSAPLAAATGSGEQPYL